MNTSWGRRSHARSARRGSASSSWKSRVYRAGRWSRSNRRQGETAGRDRWVGRLTFIGGAIVLGLLLFALFFGDMGLVKYIRMADYHRQLTDEITTIEADNVGLRDQIERLKHDPVTIEALARERLGMGRQGEIVYRFNEATPPTP